MESSSSATIRCSRCGADDHAAGNCTRKTYIRLLCSECNRLGHLKAGCPKLRRCNLCDGLGHLARDCPQNSRTKAAKNEGLNKQQNTTDKVALSHGAKNDDQASVR